MAEKPAGLNWVEAWVDVGGTFTDCLVKIPGVGIRRGKTLSTGVVPVSVKWLDDRQAQIPELSEDGEGFWRGASLCGRDACGAKLFQTSIQHSFPGGRIVLTDSLGAMRAPMSTAEILCHREAPVLMVHRLLQVPLLESLPPVAMKMGTTRGTNALLTRTGAKTALLVTSPFEDLLKVGDQTRPDLFALDIVKPTDLTTLCVPILERLAADGSVLRPLDIEDAREKLHQVREAGCHSLAISLMHSYLNPSHEQQLERLAKECGFEQISCSSRLAPVIEYVARSQTTLVDAYLGPVIREYLGRIYEQLGIPEKARLEVMTSSGGLMDWKSFSGKDCILSGPAGGVVALRGLRLALGRGPLIGLDMGGTSTDVCRVAGPMDCEFESTKAGVRILAPTLPIETVAAGGGSICWFDGVSLRVGPQSAGAMPGPACYGRGGPLTITDLNVFSGRIPPWQFPFPLDLASTKSRIRELLDQVKPIFGAWTAEQLVSGFRRIANEQMAEAVRTVSIRQGMDPRSHYLVGFGGAAGQHICEIAKSLGIRYVLDHQDAGLLSAVGMGLAVSQIESVMPVYQSLESVDWNWLRQQVDQCLAGMAKQMHQRDSLSNSKHQHLTVELRYQGTDTSLPLGFRDQTSKALREEFHVEHQRRYGYTRYEQTVELVSVRIVVSQSEAHQLPESRWVRPGRQVELEASTQGEGSLPEYRTIPRRSLLPGMRFCGPALVLNFGSTLTVESDWQAEVLSDGCLWLEHCQDSGHPPSIQPELASESAYDPVLRDCFAQRLSAIATQMGYVLQQTAISVNVKRRRDFSCAIFDGQGRLLANAPHVPVHLGAMGQTVRSVIAKFPSMEPGDVFLCNDPYEGGSHLPDLTLMMPVFAPAETQPALFVANRAHHADVGGIAPGSMSIAATRLGEEGMVIGPLRLISQGQSKLPELRQWAKGLKYPPRNWSQNEMDLAAQQAACHRGVQLLMEYAQSIGWSAVCQYSGLLLQLGHQRILQYLSSELPKIVDVSNHRSGNKLLCGFRDFLEDGTAIQVAISLTGDAKLQIDFSGTGPVSTSNSNANPSIVTAAVLYVLRCLVADELPLNDGVMRAVDLCLPESVLNPPASQPRENSPAVAAGNVETSQRVVDVLLGALGVAAASQGTMNNLLFGNAEFGFYETICGGAGATRSGAGASAVHTHMTNTRLTDPEVLEANYPVRLVEFRIRNGSGGAGRHHGGDGVVRAFEFLQPVLLSVISSRRTQGPFGLAGGQCGLPGENTLTDPSGQQIRMPACFQVEVSAGSRISVATPGGGGYGAPLS